MKFLSCIILLLVAFNSCAQSLPAAMTWRLDTANTESGRPLGYIYQIYAIGTVYRTPIKKDITALRLICSAKGDVDPIIAIYWDEETEGTQHPIDFHVDIKIDGYNFNQTLLWNEESKLTWRSLTQSRELIDAMKIGHIVSFNWIDSDKKRRYTIFSLTDFGTHINDFNTVCKLNG